MVLGIDCWDGNENQVELFKNGTNPTATFPLLMRGSSVQINYHVNFDWSLVIDQEGVVRYSDENADVNAINSTIDQLLISDIDDLIEVPQNFALFQNYPNPFNPSTVISYQLPAPGFIILTIYNVLGQNVRTLVNRRQQAGSYTVNFDAKSLASGIYYYKLSSGSAIRSRKMILSR